MTDEAMVTFTHVQKQFAGTTVIPDLTLTIPRNQIFVLVGRSGSGKTTTLKMVNALVRPDAGTITFDGKPLSAYNVRQLRWQIGYVLQQIALFPNMTVAQNIAVIPEMQHVPAEKVAARTKELLAACGLDPDVYMSRRTDELSGGEAQRIGIIRALAADPPTILMDEPFSALDPLSRRQLQDLVLALQEKLHKTIIFVTHDMNEALKMGDQIAVMDAGQLLQVGTPDEIRLAPATEFVADLFAGTTQADPLLLPLKQVVTMGDAELATPDTPAGHHVSAHQALGDVLPQLQAGAHLLVTVNKQTYLVDAKVALKAITQSAVGRPTVEH